MLVLLVLLAVLAGITWTNMAAVLAARGRIFQDPEEVPAGRVGLVFGCDDEIAGRENLFFRYRIDAAAELWHSGRLRCIIVSGDNRTHQYNEPRKMRQALIEAGVPGDKIVCDFAGLRTLDSVVRAKKIFGADQLVFITQRFQNERAIYLARANGINAVGYEARDVSGRQGWKTWLREVGARVKMWLDVKVLGTGPRHLGPMVPLPE
jgi:SanA protein